MTHEVLILPLTVQLRHAKERLTCIGTPRPYLEVRVRSQSRETRVTACSVPLASSATRSFAYADILGSNRGGIKTLRKAACEWLAQWHSIKKDESRR